MANATIQQITFQEAKEAGCCVRFLMAKARDLSVDETLAYRRTTIMREGADSLRFRFRAHESAQWKRDLSAYDAANWAYSCELDHSVDGDKGLLLGNL